MQDCAVFKLGNSERAPKDCGFLPVSVDRAGWVGSLSISLTLAALIEPVLNTHARLGPVPFAGVRKVKSDRRGSLREGFLRVP